MSKDSFEKMSLSDLKKSYRDKLLTKKEYKHYVALFHHNFIKKQQSIFKSFYNCNEQEIPKSFVYTSFQKFGEILNDLYAPSIKTIAHLLAQKGWFISNKLNTADILKFADLIVDGNYEQVDKFLVRYFRSNLRSIKKTILKSFPHRKEILALAFAAHKRKEYSISIPIFFIQSDGICVDMFSVQLYKKSNKKPLVASEVEKMQSSPFIAAFFEPLKYVLPISENTEYLDDSKLNINRHAILHGLVSSYGSEINSLKSISLVLFLTMIAIENGKHI